MNSTQKKIEALLEQIEHEQDRSAAIDLIHEVERLRRDDSCSNEGVKTVAENAHQH